jgi:hypothetical protein
MKKFRLFSAAKSVVFVLFLSSIIVSCSNSVDSDDDHEEHSEPFGVALILNGVEIAYQQDGTVNYESGDHIDIPAGEETDLMTIRFIAEDGDRFEPHADEGYSLDWLISNEDALEVEQHEEDGAWQFHLVGKNVGSSEIQFSLMHNDHSDFTSSPFVVEVHE